MRHLHELLKSLGALGHDVNANRSDVFAPVLHRVDSWRTEVGLEAVAHAAAENQIREIVVLASIRPRDQVVFRGHHEPVMVGLEIESTVDASTLIALKEQHEFRFCGCGHVG